jgi:SAM-dependent methyltransferase
MDQRLTVNTYDTDKSQLYLNNYENHFGHMADRPIRLLELGVHKGGSLLMWKDYFTRGEIAGLDVKPVEVEDKSGRIRVYAGDQRDTQLLDRIGRQCAPDGFDIVIDDASHIAAFTKVSFWHLFEHHLKPGGVFVIEDWRVGYWDAWPDGASFEPGSEAKSGWLGRLRRRPNGHLPSHCYGMVGLIKELMDELGIDAITNPARNGRPPQRVPRFRHMEIFPGQVFVVKATEHDAELVRSQLTGVAVPLNKSAVIRSNG